MTNKIKLLYVEDNPADARLLEELLLQENIISFELKICETLADTLDILKKQSFDIVLLDLGLPDSQGLHTLSSVLSSSLHIPVIIITGLKDEDVALEAIRQGAHEYYVKGEIDGRLLSRAILHTRERESLERKLKEYVSIVENVEYIIYQKTLDGEIVNWNKAAEKVYGYKAEEVIGKHTGILYPDSESDEMDRILRAIKSEQGVFQIETRHRKNDGSMIDIAMIVAPAKVGPNEEDGVSVLARDITAEKVAERILAVQYRVATIMNEANDIHDAANSMLESVCEIFELKLGGLWLIDRADNILRSSSIWTAEAVFPSIADQVFGFTFHKGEGFVGLVWESGKTLWRTDMRKLLSGERLVVAEKLDINDGLGFPVVYQNQIFGVVVFYGKKIERPDNALIELCTTIGRQMGMFINRKNIETARITLEEQLRIKNAELEAQMELLRQASEAKSIFLANMSHELRTPLNSVIGYTELMYKGKVGPVAANHQEYLGEVARNARHLLNLINQVLDLTKIESGKMQCHYEPVNLQILIDEVRKAMELSMAEKKLQYTVEFDPALDGEVSTDPVKLKQILFNYMSNAIKFTPTGGRVTVKAALENQNFYRISVSDTGIGISKNDMEKLFVVFSQLSISYSKTHQGMGLGLALTRHIADLLGGRTGVDSEVGKGSTFYVILPLVRPSVSANAAGK